VTAGGWCRCISPAARQKFGALQSYGSAVVVLVETEIAVLLGRVGLVGFERQLVSLIWLPGARDGILVLFRSISFRPLKLHVAHARRLLVWSIRRTYGRRRIRTNAGGFSSPLAWWYQYPL